MAEGIEAFIQGARMARKLAASCLTEAETAEANRAFYLIAEHDRHIERAEDYEMRAGWMIARQERRQAEMQEAAQ